MIFYFAKHTYSKRKRGFIIDTGFYSLIIDVCDFFYIVSIAILFFIYKRFDKKFQEGYQMIFANEKKKDSNKTVQNQKPIENS